MARKLIVEFIGTFFLVFTIGNCVIAPGAGIAAPLAIGASLMIMVYAGGHISGGHYNPAVSLAVMLRGKCTPFEFVGYVGSQVAAAATASFAVMYIKGGGGMPSPVFNVGPAMLAEFLFTFALAYVVLNTATIDKLSSNSYYGLAIGSTVMVGAFSVGGVSGGAFNPAVAVGITLMHLSAGSNLWVLLLGDFLGGAAAAVIFLALNLGD